MENALHHFSSKMLKLWILAASRCSPLKVKCVSLRWTKHKKEYVTVPLNYYHTTITGSLRYLSCTLNGMNIWKAGKKSRRGQRTQEDAKPAASSASLFWAVLAKKPTDTRFHCGSFSARTHSGSRENSFQQPAAGCVEKFPYE